MANTLHISKATISRIRSDFAQPAKRLRFWASACTPRPCTLSRDRAASVVPERVGCWPRAPATADGQPLGVMRSGRGLMSKLSSMSLIGAERGAIGGTTFSAVDPLTATLDGRSTAIGTAAILRFVRQVCFQDVPDEFLPSELRESNPLGIRRAVDGIGCR